MMTVFVNVMNKPFVVRSAFGAILVPSFAAPSSFLLLLLTSSAVVAGDVWDDEAVRGRYWRRWWSVHSNRTRMTKMKVVLSLEY